MGSLVGSEIELLVTEPFAFEPERVYGRCVAEGEASLLVRLHCVLESGQAHCEFLVMSVRHVGPSLQDMANGNVVTVGVTGISAERAQSPDPFDLSWWRGGGITLIGDARIVRVSTE